MSENSFFLPLFFYPLPSKRGSAGSQQPRPCGWSVRSLGLRIENQAVQSFRVTFRWSSFSCQHLCLPRGHREHPALPVTSQEAHQGEPGVCCYQPFSPFPLPERMGVGSSPAIVLGRALGRALESEYGLSACTAGSTWLYRCAGPWTYLDRRIRSQAPL